MRDGEDPEEYNEEEDQDDQDDQDDQHDEILLVHQKAESCSDSSDVWNVVFK